MEQREDLVGIFADITNVEEMGRFFEEIFTAKERDALSLRWQLLKELFEGHTQRSIAARHKISLCKITRGSKILKRESSMTKGLLEKYYSRKER